MKIPMELQSVTRTQQAAFAADTNGQPLADAKLAVAAIKLSWDAWLAMGRPLAITIDVNPLEEEPK